MKILTRPLTRGRKASSARLIVLYSFSMRVKYRSRPRMCKLAGHGVFHYCRRYYGRPEHHVPGLDPAQPVHRRSQRLHRQPGPHPAAGGGRGGRPGDRLAVRGADPVRELPPGGGPVALRQPVPGGGRRLPAAQARRGQGAPDVGAAHQGGGAHPGDRQPERGAPRHLGALRPGARGRGGGRPGAELLRHAQRSGARGRRDREGAGGRRSHGAEEGQGPGQREAEQLLHQPPELHAPAGPGGGTRLRAVQPAVPAGPGRGAGGQPLRAYHAVRRASTWPPCASRPWPTGTSRGKSAPAAGSSRRPMPPSCCWPAPPACRWSAPCTATRSGTWVP